MEKMINKNISEKRFLKNGFLQEAISLFEWKKYKFQSATFVEFI